MWSYSTKTEIYVDKLSDWVKALDAKITEQEVKYQDLDHNMAILESKLDSFKEQYELFGKQSKQKEENIEFTKTSTTQNFLDLHNFIVAIDQIESVYKEHDNEIEIKFKSGALPLQIVYDTEEERNEDWKTIQKRLLGNISDEQE